MKPQDLNDLFREEEDAALARTRKEMAEEQAKWDALPQAERDRLNAEREAAMADIPDDEDEHSHREACEACGEELGSGEEGLCSDCEDDADY